MHTALLITNSAQFHSDLQRLFPRGLKLVSRRLAAEELDGAAPRLATDLEAADVVIVDLPSLAGISQKFVQTFPLLSNKHSVIVRISAEQSARLPLPEGWQTTFDTDAPARLRRLIQDALERRDLLLRAEQLQKLTAHQQLLAAASPSPAADAARACVSLAHHRESLKTISRLFSGARDVQTLAERFLELLREQMGLTQLMLFLRPLESGDAADAADAAPLKIAAMLATGASAQRARAVTLSLQDGIGRFLADEGKILQRQQITAPTLAVFDPHLIRELELLGAEFAVPVQDADWTAGALTFSGKITGEAVTPQELEFICALCATLAAAIRNLWLNAQLASQQRFNADVLANIHSGIVVVNHGCRVVLTNRRLFELLGLTETDAHGRDLSWLPPPVGDALFETLRSGKEIPSREIALPKSARLLQIKTARFAAAQDSDRHYVVALLDDITQAKREQQQRQQAQTTQFWQQLASRLSHEMRNSMVSIRTFAQLLPEKYADASFREDFSRMMQDEIKRLDKFVDQITFFAHPLQLHAQMVNVADVIEAAVGRVCNDIWRSAGAQGDFSNVKPASIVTPKGKNVAISRHLTHSVATISADKQLLEEALVQLIRNALQAMQENGGRLSVGTEDLCDEESSPCGVRISVSDTGEGIAVADLERVFEPFYTTRNVGVGLGLTIVKKTVEAHNGRVEIASKLGKGTTLSVLLPINRDVDLAARQVAGGARSATAARPSLRFTPPARG